VKQLHSVEELSTCARVFGGVAVPCGTRVIRAVAAPNTGTVLFTVDGAPQSEAHVASLLARDWLDLTTDLSE
jgi:hypothetical protein